MEARMIKRRSLLIAASALAMTATVPIKAAPVAVRLYKNPECGCCDAYADYLRHHGFAIVSEATNNLAEISRKAGIPPELQGCHTAFIGGYVVDGHVPVEAIDRLLAEHPDIKGITLPGMPEGSPGMPGARKRPLTIYAIARDGKSSVFITL
jgi:hypothetical protein